MGYQLDQRLAKRENTQKRVAKNISHWKKKQVFRFVDSATSREQFFIPESGLVSTAVINGSNCFFQIYTEYKYEPFGRVNNG